MGVKEDLATLIQAQEHRHKYLVMEQQLGEQRIIDELKEALKEEVEPIKERITSLESTRTYCRGVIKAVGVGVPAVGSLAWVMMKIGALFAKHGGRIQ